MDGGPNPSGGGPAPRSRARAVLVTAAAIMLAISTGLAAQGGLVVGERPVFEALNDLPRPAGLPLVVVMGAGTSVGSLLLALVALLAGRRRAAAAIGGAWLVARILSTVMKVTVDRARAPGLIADAVLRQHLPADPGFPSSHAALAGGLAVAVGWAWPRARWPALVVAVLVGLARMYVGVHLPLDVVGGAALGVLSGLVAVALVEIRTTPRPSRSAGPSTGAENRAPEEGS